MRLIKLVLILLGELLKVAVEERLVILLETLSIVIDRSLDWSRCINLCNVYITGHILYISELSFHFWRRK